MEELTKWPKTIPPLSPEQEIISDDFMHHWHETLAGHNRYRALEKFNHGFIVKYAPEHFTTTLEIGAGLGEHLEYEQLTSLQKKNYVALELRENMASHISAKFPEVQTLLADCQQRMPYEDNYFDRIIAIHILEHLPDLPAAIKEIYRLCNKESGQFSVVIPCEGGWAYSFARKISAQRIFERRYKQSYDWFISREHINVPSEIIEELSKHFTIENQSFFPLRVPVINMNLCIGLILKPKKIKYPPMLSALNRWIDIHKKTFSMFVLTGATSAAVNIGLFAVFWSWLRFNYLVAVTLAYGFAVIVHFNMNRRLTFRCHGANLSSHVMKYIIMLTINLVITLIIVDFTVKALHWSPYWSVVVSIGVTMMISYHLARNWVFLNKNKSK